MPPSFQMAETPKFSPGPGRQMFPRASPTGQSSSSPLGSQTSSQTGVTSRAPTTTQHSQNHVTWGPSPVPMKSPRDYETLRRGFDQSHASSDQTSKDGNQHEMTQMGSSNHYTHLNMATRRGSFPDGQVAQTHLTEADKPPAGSYHGAGEGSMRSREPSPVRTTYSHQTPTTTSKASPLPKSSSPATYVNIGYGSVNKKSDFVVTPHKSEKSHKAEVKVSNDRLSTAQPNSPMRSTKKLHTDKTRWRNPADSDSSDSVTPPLPPLSPAATSSSGSPLRLPRSGPVGSHGNPNVYLASKTPDVVVSAGSLGSGQFASRKKASRKPSLGVKSGGRTKRSAPGRPSYRSNLRQVPPLRNPSED